MTGGDNLKKRVLYRSQTVGEGGELLRETVVTKETTGHGHTFVMLLLNGTWWSLRVRSIVDVRVLLCLLEFMNQENVVEIRSKLRGIISERFGIAMSTTHSSVRNLMNAGVIRKLSRGLYMVNPDVAFRTNARNLDKLRKEYANDRATEVLAR